MLLATQGVSVVSVSNIRVSILRIEGCTTATTVSHGAVGAVEWRLFNLINFSLHMCVCAHIGQQA